MQFCSGICNMWRWFVSSTKVLWSRTCCLSFSHTCCLSLQTCLSICLSPPLCLRLSIYWTLCFQYISILGAAFLRGLNQMSLRFACLPQASMSVRTIKGRKMWHMPLATTNKIISPAGLLLYICPLSIVSPPFLSHPLLLSPFLSLNPRCVHVLLMGVIRRDSCGIINKMPDVESHESVHAYHQSHDRPSQSPAPTTSRDAAWREWQPEI